MDGTSCTTDDGQQPLRASADQSSSYFHHESATIKLHPSSSSTPPKQPLWSMNARVYLESSSTFKTSTTLFGVERTHTPFSDHILQLISRYPLLRRLLIRVGDSASSSSVANNNEVHGAGVEQLLREERARGPSGTSILASFVHWNTYEGDSYEGDHHFSNKRQSKDYYQHKYESLLRYLLDSNLFPPCGAPLDSIRVRKHGHSTIIQSPKNVTKSERSVVEVESFLAADASSFCASGIHALLLSKGGKAGEGGWGAAANNGACHPDDNWGMFDSLFPSHSATLSSPELSNLLLRSSLDNAPWESKQNKRHSVWIDLDVSDSCYNLQLGSVEDECIVRITRGVSYRIGLPSPILQNINGGEQRYVFNLSLGDLILGNKTVDHILASEREGQKAWGWHPCPLSDSSRVSLYIPNGFTYVIATGTGVVNESIIDSFGERKLVFDALNWQDGYFDFSAPWIQIYQNGEDVNFGKRSSLFGISRTVRRPLGLSYTGSLVSVFRYDQIASGDQSSVKVESLDVLPGALVKPKIHTLRMVLYEGGGAGKDRFMPSLDMKDCSSNRSGSMRCTEVMLSDLQNHTLLLNPDGTWLIERTTMLHPDSSLWMIVDFDEAYLPWQKFPADPNRGVDAFPSRVKFTPTTEAAAPITLYSPSILLLPPVPDMSMPFNVISLSCTLWAFVLGSLLNILVRRATKSVKEEFTGEREKRPVDKLKEKVRTLKEKLKSKLVRA